MTNQRARLTRIEDARNAYLRAHADRLGIEEAGVEFDQLSGDVKNATRLSMLWWINDDLLQELEPRRHMTADQEAGWKLAIKEVRRAVRTRMIGLYPDDVSAEVFSEFVRELADMDLEDEPDLVSMVMQQPPGPVEA